MMMSGEKRRLLYLLLTQCEWPLDSNSIFFHCFSFFSSISCYSKVLLSIFLSLILNKSSSEETFIKLNFLNVFFFPKNVTNFLSYTWNLMEAKNNFNFVKKYPLYQYFCENYPLPIFRFSCLCYFFII